VINLNLAIYLQKLKAPVFGSLFMAIAVWQAKNFIANLTTLPVLLLICTLLGSAVYAIAIFLIAPKSFRQLLDLSRLALRMKA
jgi:hypothetical protein